MGSTDNRESVLPPGIGNYPGWTAEQTLQFRNLYMRYDAVARAYGQTLRPPNVTPEQAQDCIRFVNGQSALPATLANLKSIADNPKLDATAKADAAQKEFAGVAQLDAFVSGVQQRCDINDKGVRMLPLLDERGSEVYGNLYHHVTHRLADVDRVLAQKDPAVVYPPQACERAAALTQVGMRLDELPERLEKLAAGDYTQEQKQDMAREHLRQFASASQTVYSVERDLQSYDNSVRMEEKYPSKEPGFFSKAWSRVKDVASQAWEQAKSLGKSAELTPEQRYGPAKDLELDIPELANKLPFDPAVKHDTPGPMGEAWRPSGAVVFEVEAGEQGHELRKGLGFTAVGKVDEIRHDEGKVELDYTVHGHRQSIRVEEKDPLAGAVGELRPGDDFKFSISRDARGHETATVEDRTTHHAVQLRDDGHAEQKQTDVKGPDRNSVSR